jgi:hypothetical protein
MRALAVIFAVAASAALAQPNPDQTLSAVVAVSAIRHEYVLTIGYLLAAFDPISGFGLLKLAAPLGGTPLPLDDSASLGEYFRSSTAY